MFVTNTTQEIRSYLAKDLSIQKNLQRGLLNIRALAKQIIKEQNLKVSIDAVISSMRRLSFKEKIQKESKIDADIFKYSTVATKNNMVSVILENHSDIQKYLSEVTRLMDLEERETLRIIKGRRNLKIITDMRNLQKLKEFFPEGEKLEVKKDLSEIRIKISMKADKTKGVAARISNELLVNDINISEIIFCVPEIFIYVEQKDLLKAHESIINLCK